MPTIEVPVQEYTSMQEQILLLKEQVSHLTKQLFGASKSEKLDQNQLLLKLGSLQEKLAKAEQTEEISYKRKKKKAKERVSPEEKFAHLPVEEEKVIIPEEVKSNPSLYKKIGEEKTVEIDIHPPKLFKRLIIRPKYIFELDKSRPPVIAPASNRVVEGGYASAGLLSHIVISKYVDHLPLFRQEKMSRRWGAQLNRSTMAKWVETVADWLKPIYNHMRSDLLKGDYLQADETPIRYHDPDQSKGKTQKGWLWAISRPEGDVVFDWRLSRRHEELPKLIDGFKGLLQSDAYSAYISHAESTDGIELLGCMAHMRRKFFESIDQNPLWANYVLGLIAKLYWLEKSWDELGYIDHLQRTHLRLRDSAPTLSFLKKVIETLAGKVLPASGLGKACRYALNQWEYLVKFTEHGQCKLDNNLMENAIRPTAIGKKNWLFIGHPNAGQRSAVIYSVIASCQRQGIDPAIYIKDVLDRLPHMKINQVNELAPVNWKQAPQ